MKYDESILTREFKSISSADLQEVLSHLNKVMELLNPSLLTPVEMYELKHYVSLSIQESCEEIYGELVKRFDK